MGAARSPEAHASVRLPRRSARLSRRTTTRHCRRRRCPRVGPGRPGGRVRPLRRGRRRFCPRRRC
eukprot:2858530-Lingulodinium_polyedra.AAC.1